MARKDDEDFESMDVVNDEHDTANSDNSNQPTDDTREDSKGGLGDEEQVMPEDKNADEPVSNKSPKKFAKIKRFFRGYWRRKKWTLPVTAVVLLAIIFAVPFTRYPLLALGMKRQFTVVVFDSKTHTTVSGASVTLDGTTLMTNSQGSATFKAKVGGRTVAINKQYYQSFSEKVFVGVLHKSTNDRTIQLVATGRQVPVKVVNLITGAPITNAEVKVLDTEAKTDAKGMATIVLPTSSATQTATASASGYNDSSGKVQVTSSVVAANTFRLTPSGRVYFLSNLSGNIDVVATNLDGTNRKTVLAGTGNEDQTNTVLLATTDWKYLALLSKRDGGNNPKLFLIKTDTGQTATMDEGDASFQLVGWSGHHFVYEVTRNTVQDWQPGKYALKSFNADTGAITTLDQTTASGTSSSDYAGEFFGYGGTAATSLVGNKVVYVKQWQGSNAAGNQNQIMSVGVDGSGKQMLKALTLASNSSQNFSAVVYNPGVVYIQADTYTYGSSGDNYVYYTYNGDNNTLTQNNTVTGSTFQQYQQNAATYLISPSGKQSFWSQQRDGKNSLFVGDYDGGNGKQIATLSDYQTYGWYTDSYLLVEKSGSELYAMPTGGGTALKISDYYKPVQNFRGYGGGYGGL